MIDIDSENICLLGKTEKIIAFEVWFQTPFGLVRTLDEAKEIIKKNNLETTFNIITVPVAVSDTMYEILR